MRIAIVNDSPTAVRVLEQTVRRSPRHELLWTAPDGVEAIARCREQTPDVILMDLVMPGLDGAGATREIMRHCPTAILVVTASVGANCSLAFQAMGEGALDIVQTPVHGDEEGQAALLKKIDRIEQITAGTREQGNGVSSSNGDAGNGRAVKVERLVVIGASAGGPAALAEILGAIPKGFPAAILIVQHIDSLFCGDLVQWLDGISGCPVGIASEGERLVNGTVRVAGSSGHLQVGADGILHYTDEPADLVCKPSIDVLMNSVAAHWRGRAMGVILTGMGRDGMKGLLAMRNRGWLTVAQDRDTSAIYGMPGAAVEHGAAVEMLSLKKIAGRIMMWAENGG